MYDRVNKTYITKTNQRNPVFQFSPQGERIKTLHCLWCASGHIEVTVRLNRTGYTPGEDIIIDAEIANNSRRKVKSSKAELIQVRVTVKGNITYICLAKGHCNCKGK